MESIVSAIVPFQKETAWIISAFIVSKETKQDRLFCRVPWSNSLHQSRGKENNCGVESGSDTKSGKGK